jgi:hypothetical protein
VSRLHQFAQWLLDCALPAEPPRGFRVLRADDPPTVLLPGRLYLVGGRAHPWCAMLRCPCGCQETLHLDLLPDVRPRWDVRVHSNGMPSLAPSVHRTLGCRSHFFLHEGRVEWCGPDAGRRSTGRPWRRA